MPSGEQTRWKAYYEKRKDSPPRPLLLDAMARFDNSAHQGERLAIDLGCGVGTDTLALLQQGWHVLAIDREAEAITRLQAKVPAVYQLQLQTAVVAFEGLTLPTADLVYAGYSIPFCQPTHFDSLWQQIDEAVRPGGRFVGQLFGDRDDWASRLEMTFFSEREALSLLAEFELELFHEVDEDGKAVSGPKHWHYFDIIARRS